MTLSSTAKAQEADPFAGNWAGEGVELELKAANKGYGGFLRFRGTEYPVEVARDGQGAFSDGTNRFPLTLKQEGDALVVQSGTATFRLARVGGAAKANPLEGAGNGQPGMRPAGDPAAKPEVPTDPGWTTYRHPTGAYIEHPKDWRTQMTQVGLAFLPPDFD